MSSSAYLKILSLRKSLDDDLPIEVVVLPDGGILEVETTFLNGDLWITELFFVIFDLTPHAADLLRRAEIGEKHTLATVSGHLHDYVEGEAYLEPKGFVRRVAEA